MLDEIDNLSTEELRTLCREQREQLKRSKKIPSDCIHTTLRVRQADYDLLRSLAQCHGKSRQHLAGSRTRTDFLRDLVELVARLEIPKINPRLYALRIIMPEALDEILVARGKETNRSKLQILMCAIRDRLGMSYEWGLGYASRRGRARKKSNGQPDRIPEG